MKDLRDEFALKAMEPYIQAYIDGTVDDLNPKNIASDCWNIADAMMKEREAREKERTTRW